MARAAASPARGRVLGRVVAASRQRGSAKMAWRCASQRPMAQAEWRAVEAMKTRASTSSG